jgi:hypothetical protein
LNKENGDKCGDESPEKLVSSAHVFLQNREYFEGRKYIKKETFVKKLYP